MDESRLEPQAYRRFREASGIRLALALLVSVALHVGLLRLAPPLDLGPGTGVAATELVATNLPPEVRVPPPPEKVARPAVPVVPDADVSEDVTIAPTTFEANPAERMPAPPGPSAASPQDRPVFIPRDVEPRLTNQDEFLRLLMKRYPPALKDAGIGGAVTLWLYVDDEGRVARSLVKESSGYAPLDTTAEKVARVMEFEPAMNRDRPIGVWVAQRVMFQVQGGPVTRR